MRVNEDTEAFMVVGTAEAPEYYRSSWFAEYELLDKTKKNPQD